jgi:excisionase family DNA binding protein
MPLDLIGTTEAAQRLGVDRTTFFRWVQLGRIAPVMRLPGQTGAMLFDPKDVDALKVEPQPETAA